MILYEIENRVNLDVHLMYDNTWTCLLSKWAFSNEKQIWKIHKELRKSHLNYKLKIESHDMTSF